MTRSDQASYVADKMNLWLRAYKRSSKKRFRILVEYGMKCFPKTVEKYKDYIEIHQYEKRDSSWILLDYLLVQLEKELCEYSEQEVESFLDHMHSQLPLATINLFIGFIEENVFENGRTQWKYQAKGRNHKHDNSAYTLKNFAAMAYCIFNEDYWRQENLINKACSSEALANSWIFIAIHFVSALRTTDIVRIPKPELPYKGNEIRQMIIDEELTDFSFVCNDLKIRLRYSSSPPHKTEHYQNISNIKLFIPTSLEKPFGMIFAIAASYHDDVSAGSPFIRPSARLPVIKKLFGNDFIGAAGGKDFSTRRANKAYLQGLELSADYQSYDAPKGYMIAALARSHKGNIGSLPEMTKIYLKDANFHGYSPEFIMKEMFERGVFGFIPHVLLQIIGQKSYENLPVSLQTELIQQMGVSPMIIEATVALIQTNLNRAKETVKELIADRTEVLEVMHRIGCGSAVAKSGEALCLSIASRGSCSFPNLKVCNGCKYEVYTKATLHLMVKEFIRIQELAKKTNNMKYQLVLRKSIMPVIQEFLMTFEKLYPDADINDYTSIVEGGLQGYDYSINSVSIAQV